MEFGHNCPMESISKALARRPSTAWILSALWIGAVFPLYFSWKTALDLSFLQDLCSALGQADFHKGASNWLGFLKNLSCALAVVFVLWRLGRRLLTWTGFEVPNPALRFCLETALGILLLNAFWLGWGFNGLWFKPFLWAMALVLLGWSLWDFRSNFLKIQKPPKFHLPRAFFLGVGSLGLMVWVLGLFQGMAPDVYFDALVYHLSTLQFWLFHHGIADFYTNLYSYFPFGAELYFFNGFFLAGSEAAKLLNVFGVLFLALAAGGWVCEERGAEAGWLAGTMILAVPIVSATVWTTQNDVLLAFFLLAFFYALRRWSEEKRSRAWALLAGLLGGGALSVKYTAVIGLGAGLLGVVWGYGKSLPPQRKRELAWTGLVMAFFMSPWFLRNWAYTGNGFYPYFSAFMGGEALPPGNMAALLNDQKTAFSEFHSIGGWVRQIFTRDLDKTLAPLLWGFVPFLFWPREKSPCARFLMISSALYLLCGFSISHQLRLMIPAFAVCFAAMGMILGDIGKRPVFYLWGAAVSLFAFLSFLSLCRFSTGYYQTQKMWTGEETREEYLAECPQTSSYYGATRAVGAFLPPESRVLIAGDSRALYYPTPFLSSSVFDVQVLNRLALQRRDGEDIQKGLREMGVDAIVMVGEEGQRVFGKSFFAADPVAAGKIEDFFDHGVDPVASRGSSRLFKIRSLPPPAPKPGIPGM